MKTPIPGTDWIRVKTTEGNTFYSHKVDKRSLWTVPDEIKDAVESLEQEEHEKQEIEAEQEREEEARRAEEAKRREVDRVKAEVKEAVGKRKAEEAVPVDEMVISKKARVDEDEDGEGDAEGDEDDEEEEEDSDMEDWQREAAAQLAAEAEEEKRKQEEAQKQQAEEEKGRAKAEAEQKKALNMPERVDLSAEEAKALFKVSIPSDSYLKSVSSLFQDTFTRERH